MFASTRVAIIKSWSHQEQQWRKLWINLWKMCWIFWDAVSWNHLNYRRVRSRSFSSSCIVLSGTSQLVIKFPSRNFPKAENSLCSVSREMILIILTVIFPMIKRGEDYKVLNFLRDLMGVAQSFSIFRSISFAQW